MFCSSLALKDENVTTKIYPQAFWDEFYGTVRFNSFYLLFHRDFRTFIFTFLWIQRDFCTTHSMSWVNFLATGFGQRSAWTVLRSAS